MKEIKTELHLFHRHPLGEEAPYHITEAELDQTHILIFHMKNGKEVCFVKEKNDNKEMNQ